MNLADVDAGVRRTIAAYVQALDDGRTDDLVATFCDDAKIDIPGQGVFEGIDAIREAFAAWVPRAPQRHLVVNTRILEWDEHKAHALSDLVFLLKDSKNDTGWSVAMVGRYDDTFCRDDPPDDGQWHIHRRRAMFT